MMLLVLRMLLRVNRYPNELDPFEQNHGSNELELDLNCALISLSRKTALLVRGKYYKSKGILLGISFEGAPTLNFGAPSGV